MDTPVRLLRLLVLFSSRASWRADELATRLEVTQRTLRRDVARLRDLGYPIESTTGPYGGYALGAGGRLPPLLLDDDEAVAASVGLREVSHTGDPVIATAAVSALTKLAQVLPGGLRERIDTLGEVTVGIAGPPDRWAETGPGGAPALEVGVLMTLAATCRRERRVRFDYTTGDERAGRRHADPHRLVSLRRRWYLVAFDLDRDDWRTFRVDRISSVVETGARAVARPAPDAAALVAEGVAVRAYDVQATIRVHAPANHVADVIGPTVGVIESPSGDPAVTVVRIGGDADWIARYLAGLPFDCEVVDPPAVRRELRALARRLLKTHRP